MRGLSRLKIEVDCHLVREKFDSGVIATPFVSPDTELAHMLTKLLVKPH